MRRQGKRVERGLAIPTPQPRASPNALRERDTLKGIPDACPLADPLVSVQEQAPEVTQFNRWLPDGGEPIGCQEVTEEHRVTAIVFLPAWLGRPNPRRMADSACDAQVFHELQKPSHRSGGF